MNKPFFHLIYRCQEFDRRVDAIIRRRKIEHTKLCRNLRPGALPPRPRKHELNEEIIRAGLDALERKSNDGQEKKQG